VAEHTPPARGYHHGELRSALLRSALDLLAEQGLAQFSVAALAKRLGVSTAAPYRHFADRQALLLAVAIELTDRLTDRITAAVAVAGEPPAHRLAAAAGAYTRFAVDHGVGLDVIFQPGFDATEHAELHEHTRVLMDLLSGLAFAVRPTDGYGQSLVLLEDVLAVSHGYATMQRDGAFAQHGYQPAEIAAKAEAAALLLAAGDRPVPTRVPGQRS
jgi:AcrR family transcriptional regulator